MRTQNLRRERKTLNENAKPKMGTQNLKLERENAKPLNWWFPIIKLFQGLVHCKIFIAIVIIFQENHKYCRIH